MFRSAGGPGMAALLIAFALALAPAPADGATFVVNSTADSGAGSLREAIEMANASAGNDTITFDPSVFPPGNPATITPTSPLPEIDASDGVTIDGTGAGVILHGGSAGATADGLRFGPFLGGVQDVIVRNITVRNFSGGNIEVSSDSVTDVQMENVLAIGSSDGHGIYVFSNSQLSNVTLVNVTGSENNNSGIDLYAITAVTNVSVTDFTASMNAGNGLSIGSSGTTDAIDIVNGIGMNNKGSTVGFFSDGDLADVLVQGVQAQTNSTGIGFTALGDTTSNITITQNQASDNTTGIQVFGDGALSNISVTDNTVNMNHAGLELFSTPGSLSNSLVSGNTITNNTSPFASGMGVFIGGAPGAAPNVVSDNLITGNEHGVAVLSGHVTISQNMTYGNDGLGIDLLEPGQVSTGVTINDPGDTDSGANDLLNYPEILGFPGSGLAGTACANCLVEVFEADDDPTGHGEGERYLGNATADGGGGFTFEVCGLPAGAKITATATDSLGNTSEFSVNYTLPVDTPSCSPDNGDLDCDGDVDGRDALIAVIHDSGAAQISREDGCPDLGSSLAQPASAGSGPDIFGDVNCSGAADAGDAVPILQYAAGVATEPPQPAGCKAVGEPLA